MWFASPGTDRLARLDPTTGASRTFVDPAGELRGPAIRMFAPPGEPALRAWATDESGRLWLTTRNPGGIARFHPADPAGTWRHFTGRSTSNRVRAARSGSSSGVRPPSGDWRSPPGPGGMMDR